MRRFPRISLALLAVSLVAAGSLGLSGLSAAPAQAQRFKKTKAATGLGDKAVTTPSGLQYTDEVVGKGPAPRRGDTVVVHYTGRLYPQGDKFDSSVDRKEPFRFVVGVGQVIKGWDEGVISMREGGKRTLLIPPSLGYGARGAGNKIPPNSTLKFDVELLKVIPARHG